MMTGRRLLAGRTILGGASVAAVAMLLAGMMTGCSQADEPAKSAPATKAPAAESAPAASSESAPAKSAEATTAKADLPAGKVVNPAAKYLPPVIEDEFNKDVSDANRGKGAKRGGRLRMRTPADLQGLNIITLSGQPERLLCNHMTDSLVDQDQATLEYYPEMAWTWREADLVQRKEDKEPVAGRIVAMDEETVTFIPGAWKSTYGLYDVAEKNVEGKYAVLTKEHGGTKVEGTVTYTDLTVTVDGAGAPRAEAKKVTYKLSDLTTWDFEAGGTIIKRPFAKRGTAFEFYIRPGITWSDGKPFTAEDVKFSYQTIINPAVDAPSTRPYYLDVTKCEPFENNTAIRFEYKRPYFKVLAFLGGAADASYFVPKHIFQPERFGGDEKTFGEAFNKHQFNEGPIYTGPYKFKSWKRGDTIVIERNPDYWKNKLPQGAVPHWNVGQPYLDEIALILIKETAASVKALQTGDIDADIDVEPSTWVQPDTNSASFLKQNIRATRQGFLFTYIGWNLKRPVFRDVSDRKALAMLIPREEIGRTVYENTSFPVNGPFYINSPSYNKDVKSIPYDPEAAKEMLAENGWLDRDGDGIIEKEIDGEMVPFEFKYSIHNAREYHSKVADLIKESVEQAGIRVSIDKSDWTIYSDKTRKKAFDAARFAWGNDVEPDPFAIFHSSQIENDGNNYVSYKNARVDELCLEIREELDPEARWAKAREMMKIVYEDQPYCFLEGFYENYFFNRALRGIKLYPSAYPQDLTEWYWSEVPADRK